MSFAFPAGDLDRADVLLSLVGSLWSSTYYGNGLVSQILEGRARVAGQGDTARDTLSAAVARATIPVWHTVRWTPLTVKESERNTGDYALLKFDGSVNFSADTPYAFGVATTKPYHAWALPPDLVSVPLITDRITNPTAALVCNADFVVQDGYLLLRDNPFDSALYAPETVFTDGVATDRVITLWLCRAQFDRQYVHRQFAYALDLELPSSQQYKDLVNAVLDALAGGTTVDHLRRAWAAITGIPLARTAETVQRVQDDNGQTLVVTDQNVYRLPRNSAATCAAGDALVRGDSLCDALHLYELNRGEAPADIVGLALGRGLLSDIAGYFSDLVFQNVSVPLRVEEAVDGYTKVSWELVGNADDAARFFNLLHARGVAAGQTLANLLDIRPAAARTGQPAAGSLPATINPFVFLCQNVLRNHMMLVRVRASACSQAIGLNAAKILRKIIPAHRAVIVLIELDGLSDTVIMEGPGTSTDAGYSETLSLNTGIEPLAETLTGTLAVTASLTIRPLA